MLARIGPSLRHAAPFWPAATVVVLWLFFVSADGAYFQAVWYPSALGAVALLSVTVVTGGVWLPASTAARVALLGFAALVALNYASILWAGSRADALGASNKLALYLVIGWTFSILPWSPRSMSVLLVVWATGIAAFCAIDLARATSAVNLNPFFEESRYATPLDYPNATAALAVMGMWPALILSSRREPPDWIRIPLLGVAVFLAEFAFLPQSRGALVGLVLSAPLVLAAASNRIALLVRMAIVGGGLAITIPLTVDVDHAVTSGRHVAPVLGHGASVMLETSLVALVVGSLVAVAEAWLRAGNHPRWTRPRFGRRVRLAFAIMATAAVAAAAIAVAPAVGHVARAVWQSGRTDASTGSTRLLSITPEERVDYARVAWRVFRREPVLGVGAGNFAREYDALRHFGKHSLYSHDLPLRLLSETGLAGLAAFGVLVIALLAGLWRTGKELQGLGRACAVAAAAVAAYFLIHDSLDWMDEFPVLAGPALALPLAAVAMRTTGPKTASNGKALASRVRSLTTGRARFGWIGLAVVAYVAVVIALGAPYVASRYSARAMVTYGSHPTAAYGDLSRAADLNRFSPAPYISEGTIALNLGDSSRAQAAFERALGREDQWYPHLELALIDAQAGRFDSAAHQLALARSLDVEDPTLAAAKTLIDKRQRVDPVAFNTTQLQGAAADVLHPVRIR